MIIFESADVISMAEFGMPWLVEDFFPCAKLKRPEDRLIPLSTSGTERVEILSANFRQRGPYSLRTDNYHVALHYDLRDLPDGGREDSTYLSGIPIAPTEEIYVHWVSRSPSPSFITTWANIACCWADLWLPFDAINIFDDSLAFAVLFGPEEHAVYVETGPGDPLNPATLGNCLVYAEPPSSVENESCD